MNWEKVSGEAWGHLCTGLEKQWREVTLALTSVSLVWPCAIVMVMASAPMPAGQWSYLGSWQYWGMLMR